MRYLLRRSGTILLRRLIALQVGVMRGRYDGPPSLGGNILNYDFQPTDFRGMLDALEEALPNSIRIDGATPMDKRLELQDKFQNGEVDYAVLSMMAAGTGITLTRASTVVFAELWFVPGILLQAEDRAHRIGQENAVDVRYIIAAGTLDDHVYRKIQYKIRTVDRCVDNRQDRVW